MWESSLSSLCCRVTCTHSVEWHGLLVMVNQKSLLSTHAESFVTHWEFTAMADHSTEIHSLYVQQNGWLATRNQVSELYTGIQLNICRAFPFIQYIHICTSLLVHQKLMMGMYVGQDFHLPSCHALKNLTIGVCTADCTMQCHVAWVTLLQHSF